MIDFVCRAKARDPKLLYLCDPVMGDADLGFYVNEDIRALFSEGLVPIADIITPNQFELEHLVGRTPAKVEGIVAAARGLGLSTVVVTGAHFQGLPADIVQTLAIEPRAAWMVATPRLASRPSGTGELFTALLAAALVEGLPTAAALNRAFSSVYGRWWLPRNACCTPRSPLRAVRCSALAGSSRRIPMTSVAMLKRIPQ